MSRSDAVRFLHYAHPNPITSTKRMANNTTMAMVALPWSDDLAWSGGMYSRGLRVEGVQLTIVRTAKIGTVVRVGERLFH